MVVAGGDRMSDPSMNSPEEPQAAATPEPTGALETPAETEATATEPVAIHPAEAGQAAVSTAVSTAVSAAVAPADQSPAQRAYERLVYSIRNFEAALDQSQEIAMGFVGSEVGVLRIEGLGYLEPDVITFYGRDAEGMRMQMIQHVTQLSVVLRAVPKVLPAEPPRRIGFQLSSGWRGGEAGDGSVWGANLD